MQTKAVHTCQNYMISINARAHRGTLKGSLQAITALLKEAKTTTILRLTSIYKTASSLADCHQSQVTPAHNVPAL